MNSITNRYPTDPKLLSDRLLDEADAAGDSPADDLIAEEGQEALRGVRLNGQLTPQ